MSPPPVRAPDAAPEPRPATGPFLDLSRPLEPGTPVLPGDPVFASEPVLELAADGCEVRALHLGTHTGTHVDAPRHVVAGGAGVDELDLGLFHGRAAVVDVRGGGPRPIGWDDLAAGHDALRPGAVLLLLTGAAPGAEGGDGPAAEGPDGHPWLTADAARRVLETGVRAIGTDAPSPDPAGSTDLPVHRVVLGAGGVLVENLTRLEELLGREALVSFVPLRLTGADGSPVRAVAQLLDPLLPGAPE